MQDKTLVLRKDAHWYVISSAQGDEREILLALLEYAEEETYNIERDEVMDLVDQLGYRLEVHEDLTAA